VAGSWRRLHEELRNLYTSPNIVRVTRSRRMRRMGHMAHMRDEKCIQNFLSENLKDRQHVEHQGVDGRIILE
jgi:hypothetical protein